MNVSIVMAHDAAYTEMGKITAPSVSAYAQKHNYSFYYWPTIDPAEGDSCKIRIFREFYASGLFGGTDIFMWIDTDALIMNSDVRVEDIVPEMMEEYHVLYASDPNGLNTGVWFARFTSRADHFLRISQQTSWAMGWADQVGIFQTYLQPIFSGVVRIVPGKRFNAMDYSLYGWDWPHGREVNAYEPGDWILHVPAIERETRLNLLREYASLAQ